MSASGPKELFFNIYVAGDPKVGKKHLIQRMVDGRYSDLLADDFPQGQIVHAHKDIKFRFYFVPQQGISRLNAILYPRGMHAVFLVVNPCDNDSVQNIKFWLNDTNKYIGETTYKILLIAQADIPEAEWKVKRVELGIMASELGLPAVEVSAKNGEQIDFLMAQMVDECKKYYGISEMLLHFKAVKKVPKTLSTESLEEPTKNNAICPEVIQLLQARYDKLAMKFQDIDLHSLGSLSSLLSARKESTKLSRFIALHMILSKARAINEAGKNTLKMKISNVVADIFVGLSEIDKEAFRKSTSSTSSGNFGKYKRSQFGIMMQKINKYYRDDPDLLGFEDFAKELVLKKPSKRS